MDLAKLQKRFRSLDRRQASKVIKVISSNRINDVIGKLASDCSGYSCCPCDVKNGGSCSCDSKCGCSKMSPAELNLAELYESVRNQYIKDYPEMLSHFKVEIKTIR
jgi:hypothetical protein